MLDGSKSSMADPEDPSGIKLDELPSEPGTDSLEAPPPSYLKAMDYANRRAMACKDTGQLSDDDMQYFRSLYTQGRQELEKQQQQQQQMVLLDANEVKKAMVREEIELQTKRLASLQELKELMDILHEDCKQPQKKMDKISRAAEVVVKKSAGAQKDLKQAYYDKKALQRKKFRCLILMILLIIAGGVVLYFLLIQPNT